MDEARSVPGGGPDVFELARQLRCEFDRQERLFGSQDCVLGVENFQELEDLARDIFIRVRTLNNATKPIHKLPPEVLIRVFSLVPTVQPYSIGHEHSCSFRCVEELCPLLFVCRHWHRIIMGTPELWATMYDRQDDDEPPMFSGYLHRCPSGPLYVAGEQGASPALLSLLKANGPRVKELRITFPDGSGYWQDYTPFAQLSLPALEFCTIDHEGQSPETPPLVSVFPDSNKLRALQLTQAPYVPSSPFPTLTALVLSDLELNVSMSDLLTFLSGSPRLEHIRLERVCPRTLEATEPGHWHQRGISLKYLRELAVHNQSPKRGSQQLVILAAYRKTLLSVLIFPASCILSISHITTLAGIQQCLDLAWGPGRTALAARFSTKIDQYPDWQLPTSPRHEGYYYIVHLLDPAEHSEVMFGLDINIKGIYELACYHEWVTRLPSAPCVLERLRILSSVRMLWIEGGVPWLPPCREHATLAFPPCLEFLVLERGNPVPAVVNMLQPMAPDGRIVCPSLSTLMLDLGYLCSDDLALLARIHAAAAARAAAGHPIQRLMLAYYEDGDSEDEPEPCRIYDGEGAMDRKVDLDVAYKELAVEWAERTNWRYDRFDSDDEPDSSLASDTAQEDTPEDAK